MTLAVSTFERSPEPPPVGSTQSLSNWWDHLRDSGIAPRFVSELDESEELREEFMAGAQALGLVGRRKTLQPQQLLLADVLNANARFTGVLLPRRSAKTTTLLAWLIGRCLGREDYLCAYAVMTSQKKSRDRFLKDVIPILQRVYPDEHTRPFGIRTANGTERLVFDNGSVLQFLGPNPDDFRSDAYDVIVLDESGEAEPEEADEVLAAALPTQDTRPGAMIIKAGTAAKFRKGQLLWEELEAGRTGEARHAILEYSTGDVLTDEELEDWDLIAELIAECHPGVGGLTTMEAIEDNWKSLKPEQFAREYLGIFGMEGQGTGLIRMDTWAALAKAGPLPKIPARFAMAISTHPDQLSASIGVAWRDRTGKACIALLDHRKGVKWLADQSVLASRQLKTAIIHDNAGVVTVEVESIARRRPKPKLLPQTFPNIKTAAALLVKEIETGNLIHFDQPDMNEAARVVSKRKAGLAGGWALGRGSDESNDITPLEAAAMALRVYDDQKTRVRAPIM